jgi:hypothetical protein
MIIGNDFGDKNKRVSVSATTSAKEFFLEKMAQKSSDLDAKVNVKSPDFRPHFVHQCTILGKPL